MEEITIYCGNNRQTKVWKEQKTTFEELCEKLKNQSGQVRQTQNTGR